MRMNNGLEFLVHTENVTTPIMSVMEKCQLHSKNFLCQQTLVISCILQLPLHQGEFILISSCAEAEKISIKKAVVRTINEDNNAKRNEDAVNFSLLICFLFGNFPLL